MVEWIFTVGGWVGSEMSTIPILAMKKVYIAQYSTVEVDGIVWNEIYIFINILYS